MNAPPHPPILMSGIPPLPDEDDDDINAGAEINNPTGGTAMDDDDVIFFDVAASNTDATLDASLGPSADADDVEPASHPAGLSAAGPGAPSASDASLGLPAGRSPLGG